MDILGYRLFDLGSGDGCARLGRCEALLKSQRRENLSEVLNAATWGAFALGLIAATAPVWRYYFFGRQPSIDGLLSLRCFGL